MKKNISIFALTLIFAFIIAAIIFVFSGCQKEDTIPQVKSDVPLNEGVEIRGVQLRNGERYDIIYFGSKSTDNKTVPGVPRIQRIYNASKIDTFYSTPVNNTTVSIQEEDANGNPIWVQNGIYSVVISYKDGTNEPAKTYFAKSGTPYITIPSSNSILSIASTCKWSQIENIGQLSDHGSPTRGKNKKYYTYRVTTNLGALFDTKIEGSKENSNVFTFKHY